MNVYRLKLHLYGSEVKDVHLEPGREYTVGRGDTCDIVLEEQPGISRSHFRLSEIDGQWTLQVLSKFGFVMHAGQQVGDLQLTPGTAFKLAAYDFRFEEVEDRPLVQAPPQVSLAADDNLPVAVGQSESLPALRTGGAAAGPGPLGSTPLGSSAPPPPPEEFEGNDEATRVGVNLSGVPYLRIVEADGTEETRKIDGKKVIVGRDETCDIVLNERKASRRQFELTSSSQGYFIRDLGSANGTVINGMPLAPDELKSLRSGDAISVATLTIHFEIRDPNFEKKLMVIAPEVLAQVPVVAQSPYEMINYPVPSGPGGAIRIDQLGGMQEHAGGWPADADPAAAAKKKKIRLYAIIAAIVLGAGVYSNLQPSNTPPPSVEATAFSKLAPEQQKIVKETYVLARNLLIQGKHSLASTQIQKIHELLPEGYEKSREMEEECKQQALNEEQMRFIEQERVRQAEDKRVIEENLRACQKVADNSMNTDEIRNCLGPTFDRNPNEPRIEGLIQRVQARIDLRERQAAEQKDYQERVGRGRALFAKADDLDKSGSALAAIDAYRKHLASSFPDPANLKGKSRVRVDTLTKDVTAKVDESLAAAESAFASQNYREAIDNINRAKELDPGNTKVAEVNAKVRREVTVKMKELYTEAIIAEGIGLIDEAKEKWKRIMSTDHPEGEYYKRAKNKLRAYGVL